MSGFFRSFGFVGSFRIRLVYLAGSCSQVGGSLVVHGSYVLYGLGAFSRVARGVYGRVLVVHVIAVIRRATNCSYSYSRSYRLQVVFRSPSVVCGVYTHLSYHYYGYAFVDVSQCQGVGLFFRFLSGQGGADGFFLFYGLCVSQAD